MGMLLYLIGAIVVIYMFFIILPVLLPIIIVFVAVLLIFIWYVKRKVQRKMKDFENQYTYTEDSYYDDAQGGYTADSTQRRQDDDIIDVEFTESDDLHGS